MINKQTNKRDKEILSKDILYFCCQGYLKDLSLKEIQQIYNMLIKDKPLFIETPNGIIEVKPTDKDYKKYKNTYSQW